MKVIIIGGVAAGMSAAAKFKRLSPKDDVVVYEKGDIVSFGSLWATILCWRVL